MKVLWHLSPVSNLNFEDIPIEENSDGSTLLEEIDKTNLKKNKVPAPKNSGDFHASYKGFCSCQCIASSGGDDKN
jgi:hypothetical protein